MSALFRRWRHLATLTMPDYSRPGCVTLSFGRQGSGKSTFCYRYLVNAAAVQPANPEPAACIFVFDWKLEARNRLGLPLCTDVNACEQAIQTRWVCYHFANMFGAKKEDAFRWFCHWAFEVSKRGPGRKIMYIDELWKFMDARSVPEELETIARMGRSEGLELLTSTQHPRDYHRTIKAEVTEWVCFQMMEDSELEAVRDYYRGVDKVAKLPKGHFLAYNVDSGGEIAGRVF